AVDERYLSVTVSAEVRCSRLVRRSLDSEDTGFSSLERLFPEPIACEFAVCDRFVTHENLARGGPRCPVRDGPDLDLPSACLRRRTRRVHRLKLRIAICGADYEQVIVLRRREHLALNAERRALLKVKAIHLQDLVDREFAVAPSANQEVALF